MGFKPLLELGHYREVLVTDALVEGVFQSLPVFLGPALVLVAVGAGEVQLRVHPLALESFPFARVESRAPVRELRSTQEPSPCPTLNRVSSRLDSGQSSAFRLELSVG